MAALVLVLFFGLLTFTYYIAYQLHSRSPLVDSYVYSLNPPDYSPTTIKVQELTFTTRDNFQLKGLLIERAHAPYVVLICHGYRHCKLRLDPIITFLPEATILLLDLRAHGKSEGHVITFGAQEIYDVEAAYTFLTTYQNTRLLPICGIGFSMGGATLLHAAAQKIPFKALVIDSSFAVLKPVVLRAIQRKTWLPVVLMPLVEMWHYIKTGSLLSTIKPLEWAQQCAVPTLIIHSKEDTLIPVTDALLLYNALKGPKELWLSSCGKHAKIDDECPEEYMRRISTFFAYWTRSKESN